MTSAEGSAYFKQREADTAGGGVSAEGGEATQSLQRQLDECTFWGYMQVCSFSLLTCLSRKGYFVFRNGLVPAIRTWVILNDYVWQRQRWVRGWNFNIGLQEKSGRVCSSYILTIRRLPIGAINDVSVAYQKVEEWWGGNGIELLQMKNGDSISKEVILILRIEVWEGGTMTRKARKGYLLGLSCYKRHIL